MSRFPSRLSRQELYSYGFKEGEPWGDDRRTLEAALREIDQHEREIQENYVYNRPAHSNPWIASSTPRHYPGTSPIGHLSPRLYPPDIRMNRSNESDSSYASSESSLAPWDSRNNGYGHGRAYRDFPESPSHASKQSSRPDRFYASYSGGDEIPATFHQPSRTRSQNYSGQNYAPSISSSTSSYRNFNALEDSPKYSEVPYYYPNSVPPTSPRHTTSPARTFSQSSQMQLTRYDGDHEKPPREDHENRDFYSLPPPPPPTSPKTASPRWSITTTLGTGSDNLSVDSSRATPSEDSATSGYTDAASKSSGYVESYEVQSHGHEGYHQDYRDPSIEVDQDYMSDGVASDEGVYYSSGEELEGEVDEEVYSDEGYSSYSEDDAGYSDYE
ncbi:hypothetical protein GALMADRAFT_133409 [Galerina marginata CBS 339.88]|uniref:Uncharacterized protein n=1 Tax=Galerina marginata (strain CBS 339.88) TaxID=685588 RepID=A0A067TLL5_GALM3|nr:hypothetical protein GALMADRAFT_133409 [Galerina marginata CBS 339.88]